MRSISDTKRIPVLCLTLLLVTVACASEADSAETQAQTPSRSTTSTTGPIQFGEPFAAGAFVNVNRQAGGPANVDLDQTLGTKPVLLYYWIAGNPRADEVFQQVQALADELGSEKLALYGVVFQRNERDVKAVADRVVSLGIKVPVLNDEGFRLGKRLRVQSVPNVTIFDVEGRLRLTNGASLIQGLEYKMDLTAAIRRVAETGTLGTYGFLGRYYPVKELVGKKCPDFKAPLLGNSIEQRWSSMLSDDKVNLLIFWSIDCPHCRKSLPEINTWLKANGEGVNVVSAAKVTDEVTKIKTKEFCDINEFVFPTLADQDLQIAGLYQVTTTPTILIIRPDGVVDSVMLSTEKDFGKTVEAKKKSLL
jgi:thiol-disulfide isomerase/thioredoxin